MKRFWLLAAIVLLLPCWALADGFVLPVEGGEVEIITTELDGTRWLFLPSFANIDALFSNRVEVDGVWQTSDENGQMMQVMQSANLRALFLTSDDPVNEGRAFIENCERHENKTTGSIVLVDECGAVSYAGDLRQIRGRGNGTWSHDKRPYQIKLEERADLLNTGDPMERNRTWVLLAEATDGTMLHNKLAYDLGLELGMANTSHSEFVDLYYDGEYRGTYLLAEKVEINKGRIAGRDYDDLIEEWNRNAGVTDLESLPVGYAENRFGKPFSYIMGLQDSGWLDAGTYMLEMESSNGHTLSDRCWFRMKDDSTIALKSPENASEAMVRYISERLTEARATLQNKGLNPENGRTIEDDFNVDAFARLALINELAYNIDGFTWSSTWFVLPEGATRFEPGTSWDFDLGWRYTTNGSNKNGTGAKDETGWLPEFYQCKAFSDRMYEIYRDELYPLVKDILLGEGQGKYLQSLTAYEKEIEQSVLLNSVLWPMTTDDRLVYGENWEEEHALLRQFITERSEWMYRSIVEEPQGYTELVLEVIWSHPDTGLQISFAPWSKLQLVSYESTIYEEATEEDYAIWQAEIILERQDGIALQNTNVIVNGGELEGELMEDGRLRLLIGFEDLSYRPVDYYGEDIGLIYNYDFYIQNHPEVLDVCGDDPEAVMEYFCDEGMYEGHQGNGFFYPVEILYYNPVLKNMLGTDWQNYYWDFLGYGHDEGWIINFGTDYEPKLWSML